MQWTRKPKFQPNVISFKGNIILNIVLSLFALVCVLPLLLILAVSITEEKTLIAKGYSLFPEKLSLYAYDFITSNGAQLLRSYGVTTLVTVVGTVLSLSIIALYAYPISRKDFKHRNFFAFFVFFTMLFNGGLVPWYLISVQVLHLRDNIWGLIFPYLVNPLWVLIMRTYFVTSIPDSVIESAKIDGAGELRIFISIIAPLSLPGLATIGLFNTLRYWNDWWLGFMFITNPRLTPLQFLLYRVHNAIQYLLQNAGNIQGGEAATILQNMPSQAARMALCIIGIGPVVIAFPFFQKYFVKGLTLGALKG